MGRSGGREQGRGYRNLQMPSRWLCTSGDCWLWVGRGQGAAQHPQGLGQGTPTAEPSGRMSASQGATCARESGQVIKEKNNLTSETVLKGWLRF